MRRRFAVSALMALGALSVAQLAEAATNFDVTANGMSAYVIGGVNNPTLTLTKGQTYTFNVIPQGHPFWIATARGAGDAEANKFSTGVTNNGATASVLTFTVPASAPSTLFYQCSFHDPMGGTLNIAATAAAPTASPSMGPIAFAALAGLLACVAFAMLKKHARS